MTYAPTPYAAPVQMTDPTNVMGRRIGAYFIDVVAPTAVAFIVGFSIWLNDAHEITNVPKNYCEANTHTGLTCIQAGNNVYLATNAQTRHALAIGFLIWLVAPLNAIVLQGITGATVGKYMFGLRVVRGDGSKAGFGWVLLRSLLFIVDNMCFALVGLISSLVTHPHRRVGDMAAGTYVVGKDSVGRTVAVQPAYAPPPVYTGMYAPPPTTTAWTPPPAGDAPAPTTAEDPAGAGWAAPIPGTESQPAGGTPAAAPTEQWRPPAPHAAPPPVQDPTEPHWDPARNAWIAWEPTRGQWMQFDANTNEWRPM